jgi:BirA family transcriptional regulator, biotin operon repressor / biotin---[acetyl-CoA-carboxylase] ligase
MQVPCLDSWPDTLDIAVIQSLLKTRGFGHTVHLLPHTASTNDVAKLLAQQGAPEGTVVLAEQQTQGRGRQGRSFASPAYVGVYLSLLTRPRLDLACLPQLTLVAAVAVAEAIVELSALPLTLKWPNDIEIAGKKVAGILTEALLQADAHPVVIIGIGINVNTSCEQFPPELRHRATSLALAAGHPWSRQHLIALLLTHLERLYDVLHQEGIDSLLQRWLYYGRIVGRLVRFMQPDGVATGRVLGLDADGALLVQRAEGASQRIVSGEVTFIAEPESTIGLQRPD